MRVDPHLLDRYKTRLGFERAASTYDANAVLQREIGERLTERLDLLTMQPKTVLDIGCGTGAISQHLLKRYPQAHIVGLDLAWTMARRTHSLDQGQGRLQGICADAACLPLQDHAADMLLSNLMLQWCNDLTAVFREFVRVLKPQGTIFFSTFGPDTLQELRQSWQQVDGFTHASKFVDMHDIGDAMLKAGFRDPVVDMEIITLTYQDVKGLLRDLKGIGANNATFGRNHGLTGKKRMQAFFEAYEQFRQEDGLYPATYEVIYGHAWAPQLMPSALPEKFIPIKPVSI